MTNQMPTADELQNQLTDLKAEILELSRALSTGAGDFAERARPAVDEVDHRLRGAARAQGQALVDTVKENPGATTSIAVTAGILGMAIGCVVGSTFQSSSTSHWR